MADAASGLTHLPDRQFISHFRTHFLQSKPWRLLPIPSMCRRQLTKMLHNKRSPRDSLPPSSRKTPPHGANGGISAAGCKFPPTSNALNTPFIPPYFLPSVSVPDFCSRKGIPSRSDRSSNTSAPLVKSSHPWGLTTPATTPLGKIDFRLGRQLVSYQKEDYPPCQALCV